MSKQETIKRYNDGIEKINSLELEGDSHLFDLIPEDYNGEITENDIEWTESHYQEMKQRYQELELGIYSK